MACCNTALAELDAMCLRERLTLEESRRQRRIRVETALSHLPRPFARPAASLAIIAVAVAVIFALTPVPAHAEWWDAFTDPAGFVNGLIVDNILKPACESAVGLVNNCIQSILQSNTLMTAGFDGVLGDAGQSVRVLIHTVNVSLVQPIAIAIFAFVMLVRLIEIAGKVDANGIVPGLRDIVMFAIFVFLFETLILNAEGVCIGIYEIVNDVTVGMLDPDGVVGQLTSGEVNIEFGEGFSYIIGDTLVTVLLCGAMLVIALISMLMSQVMFLARGIEIYCLAMLSSVAFALLGNEYTRSMGIGFIKHFAAVCLSGVIMVFSLVCFQVMLPGVAGTTVIDNMDGLIGVFGSTCVILIVLCFSLLHSGAWARNVLGG